MSWPDPMRGTMVAHALPRFGGPPGASGARRDTCGMPISDRQERYSGLTKSNRAPASHSLRWFPCAGNPPADLSIRAKWSRFQVMKVVLRLVNSLANPTRVPSGCSSP